MKSIAIYSAIVVAAFFSSCGEQAKESTSSDPNVVRFDSLMQAFDNEQLVDVRTPEEYGSGHIEGASNYSWNDSTLQKNISELDPSKPVLVYCHSGKRSASAGEYLRNNGFKQVYELEGGIAGWEAAGQPITAAEKTNPGEVTLDAYNKTLADNDVVLVDFSATWCGPCKMLAPSLEELKTELAGKFVLLNVDVDRDRPVADYMNIQAMPTLVLYKKGQVQWRNEGVVPKDMVAEKINSVQ
jgi:thioredoxin 1